MSKLLKSPNFFFFVLIFLFLTAYWRVPFIFFVQDELLGFGLIIDQGLRVALRGLRDEQVLHFIPINNSLNFLAFSVFNLNFQFYNIVGLFFHFINGLLVYRLAKKMFKSQVFAAVSSIVFVVSAIPSQLIMWPMVSINTVSLSFALLAWIHLLRLRDFVANFQLGAKVAFFVLLSILTLEYSLALLVFVPITSFIYYDKKKSGQLAVFLLPLICVSVFYFGLRFHSLFYFQDFTNTQGSSFLVSFSEKLTKLPFQYVGQVFVSQKPIIGLATWLSNGFDASPEHFLDQIPLVAGIIILVISVVLFFSKQIKSEITQWRESLLVALVFVVCSSLPFLFITGLAGDFKLYPSRYLYFGLVGVSMTLALYVSFLLSVKNKVIFWITIFMLFLYLVYNVAENWKISENLYNRGQTRLGILNSISNRYKVLPDRVVFYTESDSSFYGLPSNERIMPFQSGFGQTLLVWYYQTEKFPLAFFRDKFLWEITDQGYREAEGQGFGYFRDSDLLAQTIREKNLPSSSVISFRYNSQDNVLTENTEEVQGRIAGHLADKREVDPRLFVIASSINIEDTPLMFDRKRDTFWNSEVPYATQQTVDIDLRDSRKIAQVRVDSYNNKDQNEVGYEVSTSQDGKNWGTAFYARRYPPDENGYVDLFFEPQVARFIRIRQIGYHEYAPWVIHELKVYEASD